MSTPWWGWLFDSRNYMPHGHCYLWQPGTLWLNVGGDLLIAAAYFTIPVILYAFVRQRRHEIPYWWIPLLFAAFILLCGATHAFDIFTVWNPEYRLEGALKVVTGLVSATTAVALLRVMPGAMQLQTPAQLQREVTQRTDELAAANARLREEIAWRQAAEQERATLLAREQAARADAERANRSKDEFLAMLSHELRTPLSTILSWAQILGDETRGAEVTRGAAIIERNARAQVQLISDLLDMSRITAGKLRLDVQPVDLAQVIDAALETVRPSADARGIRLRRIVEALEEPVLGDPGRLQQVVWNLLSNAIKFTPKGGHVEISLARVNSHVELIVTDSGRGIEPDVLPYVFQRFQQADSSAARAHGGLGLGLAIVKELVELHGGQVRAASDGAGRGATFVVELPLVALRGVDPGGERVHPRAEAPGGLLADLPRLDGLRVLVVEDQRDAADGIARVLGNAGAEVAIALSADQGLAALAERLPDVVVSDIGMPERDGYDFIRAVRARHGRLPAAALTAFARSEDRTRALLAGYDAHVAKPVEVRELLATVAALADRRGAPSDPDSAG